MRLLHQPTDYALQLTAEIHQLSLTLSGATQPHFTPNTAYAGESLTLGDSDMGLVVDGTVYAERAGKRLFTLEAGDLFGLCAPATPHQLRFVAATPLQWGRIARSQFLQLTQTAATTTDLFRYLSASHNLLTEAYANALPAPVQPQTGFLHVNAGDTIIQEGESADQVYTLIQGRAAAYREGIKVGDITENEIFGAMAVFTQQPRMASVIAITPCILLAVPKQDFLSVVDQQPQVCTGLITEMSNRINQLNAQLIRLQGESVIPS